MARSTAAGQPAIIRFGAADADFVTDLQDAFSQGQFTQLSGSADAVPFPGNVAFTGSGVDASTLAAPKAGSQRSGGDDGKSIFIVDTTGHAHTVTTPSNAINAAKHVLTWNGTAGSSIELRCFNGVWWVVGTPSGVTVS